MPPQAEVGLPALRLSPEYHERVWGGRRLAPGAGGRVAPVGEAWLVYEHNRVAAGPHAGRTLAEVAAGQGEALLGRRVAARTGARFPLLIKLLDTADWLSLQVHPDDAQAARLEGPGQFGKTEAWHILEAAPGAELIYGLRPGTTQDALAAAIREGTILDLARRLAVRAGDTLFIPAGTVHALGPGLLLYEVQQTSDITYRVYDWDRPQAAGRALHVDQSLAVADPGAAGEARPAPPLGDGDRRELTACPYFTLDLLGGESRPVALDTGGETFHALTVTAGSARAEGPGWSESLARFETVVVPASCGAYEVRPEGPFRALKASV